MSAKDDGLTGEVLHAPDYREGAKVFLYHCQSCGRVVLNEMVFVDDSGDPHCMGCREVNGLGEDL